MGGKKIVVLIIVIIVRIIIMKVRGARRVQTVDSVAAQSRSESESESGARVPARGERSGVEQSKMTRRFVKSEEQAANASKKTECPGGAPSNAVA